MAAIALEAVARQWTGAMRVTVRSGAMEAATKSRPISAPPAPAQPMKKLAKSLGSMESLLPRNGYVGSCPSVRSHSPARLRCLLGAAFGRLQRALADLLID